MPEKKTNKEIRVNAEENLMNIEQAQACTERHYELTRQDLPLSCPQKHMRVWDAHPRVYLPIEKKGKITCPYCGAFYVLKDFDPENSHNGSKE